MKELFRGKSGFHIVGYSVGTILGIEIAKELEKIGLRGKLTLIDGSPLLFKKFLAKSIRLYESCSVAEENAILSHMMQSLWGNEQGKIAFDAKLRKQTSFNEKVDLCIENLTKKNYSSDYLKAMLTSIYNRLNLLITAEVSPEPKLKCPITLVRVKQSLFIDIADDYELSQYSKYNKIDLNYVDGDHYSCLSKPGLIDIINKI